VNPTTCHLCGKPSVYETHGTVRVRLYGGLCKRCHDRPHAPLPHRLHMKFKHHKRRMAALERTQARAAAVLRRHGKDWMPAEVMGKEMDR